MKFLSIHSEARRQTHWPTTGSFDSSDDVLSPLTSGEFCTFIVTCSIRNDTKLISFLSD